MSRPRNVLEWSLSMLGKTTVFIILDAFRWDYLNPEDTPFLWQRASEGLHVRRMISSTGFAQRAAMFTGAYPDVTDCYTMFCYDREDSPYWFLTPLREPLRWLRRAPSDSGALWT
jgi:predicted AlkP superfamily pyrophosphatase or phosphodiesterase